MFRVDDFPISGPLEKSRYFFYGKKLQGEALTDLVRMAERIGIDKTKIPENIRPKAYSYKTKVLHV